MLTFSSTTLHLFDDEILYLIYSVHVKLKPFQPPSDYKGLTIRHKVSFIPGEYSPFAPSCPGGLVSVELLIWTPI